MKSGFIIKRTVIIILLLALCAAGAPLSRAEQLQLTSIPCGTAERIIVERAMRLAFLGDPDGNNTWTPNYSFLACNVDKRYQAGKPENSMPYSRSALFNDTEFSGLQQYIGWVDADTGMTPSYEYTVANFLSLANTRGSVFDRAAAAAYEADENWGALLGSDCSAFLSYAWQIPHMTTYMFISDAVDFNICREVPATKGHTKAYTVQDLKNLLPGDAMICANISGTDEHGNPLYRGHCIIITDIRLDSRGTPVEVVTVEEISPRARVKTRTAEEFLEYANKLHVSGAYYKFYRLISKRHLKLEIEISYNAEGGRLSDKAVACVFALTAEGSAVSYADALDPVPERDGYTFLGWALSPDGEILSKDSPITTLRDHTLYAVWKEA